MFVAGNGYEAIDQGKQNHPDGIVYIGEGGLGAPLREPDMTRWFMQGGFGAKEYHVWMINITYDQMHLSAIGMETKLLPHYILIMNAGLNLD